MSNSMLGLSSAVCLLAGCAAAPRSAGTHSSTGGQSVAFVATNSTLTRNDEGYKTVYVAPQTGSLLGGGYVRVIDEARGNDERALLDAINELDAAVGRKGERSFGVTAISHAMGVNERELQAQQNLLRVQFTQLCAINAIARGDRNKVGRIASLKSKGKTRTELAASNGVGVAPAAQTPGNATTSAATANANAADRTQVGADKLKGLGIHPR